MDGPLCRGLILILILTQSHSSNILLLIATIFTFNYDKKYKSNKQSINLFIPIFASKPSSVPLQSHLRDTLCLLPAKVDSSTFSTQICPEIVLVI